MPTVTRKGGVGAYDRDPKRSQLESTGGAASSTAVPQQRRPATVKLIIVACGFHCGGKSDHVDPVAELKARASAQSVTGLPRLRWAKQPADTERYDEGIPAGWSYACWYCERLLKTHTNTTAAEFVKMIWDPMDRSWKRGDQSGRSSSIVMQTERADAEKVATKRQGERLCLSTPKKGRLS